MNNQSVLKEFSTLPPDAQREVIDFIGFLKTRYITKNGSSQNKLAVTPIEEETFIGMWHKRKDLENSSKWVKQIRTNDWK